MATRNNFSLVRMALGLGLLVALAGGIHIGLVAQAQAAASTSKLGTVKTVAGSTVTMATDQGQIITVNVADTAKILKLPPGSTSLPAATPGQLSDIAVGDRALVTGAAGDAPTTINAARVIVMKSGDIAQMQAAEQADWKARGVGGIVSSVDPASGTITITSGAKKITIETSAKTDYKRFAGDSVKFQDAKPGTLAQIQPKDQLQARGTKSADGTSVAAEEIVSGSFLDLSGLVTNVDAAAGTITLKDLATKRVMTVDVTAHSDIRKMSPQIAARFAQGGAGAQGGGRRGGGGGGGGGAAAGGGGGQAGGYGGGAAGGPGGGAGRSAGADLSQMISRLPAITMADLNKGDAVMIVANEPTPGASTVTAVTVLSGVDAILTANPNGGMDLSSWSMGGGGGGDQ